MPIYTDQFFVMDPGNPPAVGTALTMVRLELNDVNGNGVIRASNSDLVGGLVVNAVWQNDKITVTMGGVQRTITGVTFYRNGGAAVFTPTDGTVLSNATFVRSTYVTTSTQATVGSLGPACFLRNTLIETPSGARRIDTLRAGDLVLTRDHGAQALAWVGHSRSDAMGEHAPIRFEIGALGNDRALLVSPQHRMLVSDWRAQMYFGVDEVFVHARHMVNGVTIRAVPRARVDYYHLMFARHEVVMAHGAASESFYPGDVIMQENPVIRAQVLAVFPELASPAALWPLARPMARGFEAAMLGGLDGTARLGKMTHHVHAPQTQSHSAQIISLAAHRRRAA